MRSDKIFALVLYSTVLTEGTVVVRNVTEEQATIDILESLVNNYDKDLRPYFATGTAVDVTVDMYLASLNSIREDQMDFGITVYLRQQWHDPRLEFSSSVTLPPTTDMVDKIWLPDLVIGNMKTAKLHNLTMANRWVQIDGSGHVLYTARLSIQLSCAMDFHHFPFDNQKCTMELDSCEYSLVID
ncbi:glycine receptor subunit alpha-3-like [Amphiura filiformis]|uniref:glycine receptor subunit alpha-3-like n=1 Tax=Amphiura filiformis TaxID=82378 RepID=UPI003B21B8D5